MFLSSLFQSLRNSYSQLHHRHDLTYLFIFALVLRLCFLVLMLGQVGPEEILNLSPDSTRYVNIGRGLAEFSNFDEGAILIFGPGYGLFLGAIFLIFGISAVMVLIIQALLGSLTCLIIYRLGHELTGSRYAGYIAAVLSAVSFTAISLSNYILSDALFLFLLVWGNLVFILGLQNRRISYFLLSGICIGAAILTRTMAQFWPLIMMAMIFVLPGKEPHWQWRRSRIGLFKKAWLAPGIALLIMAIWIGRNYSKHDLPALAIAGSHGLGRLSVATLTRVENRDVNETWGDMVKQYKVKTGKSDLTLTDQHRMKIESAGKVFDKYPGAMISTYFGLIGENLLAVNELYQTQLPRYKNDLYNLMNRYRQNNLHYSVFVLSMIGFLCMVLMRRWRPLVFLGLFYVYMLAMIGFGQWQGSRLFYPGQMAWTISIGFFLVSLTPVIKKIGRWALTKSSVPIPRLDLPSSLRPSTLAIILLAVVSVFYLWHALQYGSYINDDAGISFTYARNLADGHGLVFNPGGEKVEGYSNPLWVFIMAACIKVGIFNPVYTPKVISMLLTLLSFGIIFKFFSRSAISYRSVLIAFLTTLMIAANSSLTVWSVSGLENGLYNFLILYAVYRLYLESGEKCRLRVAGVLLFLLAITRPEGFLLAGLGFVLAILFSLKNRNYKNAITVSSSFVFLFGLYHLWHYYYFSALLPNTYYAKKTGVSLSNVLHSYAWPGWKYIKLGLISHKLYLLIPLAMISFLARNKTPTLMLGALAIASLALPVFSRGDWMMEYRLLHPFFMLLIVMAGMGIWVLIELYKKHRYLIFGPIAAVCLAAMLVSGYVSLSRYDMIRNNLTVPFQRVKAQYHEFNSRLADSLMIVQPSITVADIGATGYYGGMTIYDVGLLADYHLARYRFQDYYKEYILEELRPDFIGYQGAAVACFTKMHQYPEFAEEYLTYEEVKADENRYGPDVYDGHYIRKDIVVKKSLSWYADSANFITDQGCRLQGYINPYAIDRELGRLAVALYWQSPSPVHDDQFQIVLNDKNDKAIIEMSFSVGYEWYKPGRWLDTGYVCQYLFIPVNDTLLEGEYELSIVNGAGDQFSLGRILALRKYDHKDVAKTVAGLSKQFVGNIATRLRETGIYMKMLRADYWGSETGRELIGGYVRTYLGEYRDPSNDYAADSILEIFTALRSLNPIQKDATAFGEKLNRYYVHRGEEYIEKGWRYYADAFDCFIKALAASAKFPEVRKEIETIRPWTTYLKNHPELLDEYGETLPIEKWLMIYQEFSQESPYRRKPFRSLLVNLLLNKEQISIELKLLSVWDRLQLYDLGLISGPIEKCYTHDRPQATYSNKELTLVVSRLTKTGESEYLFEAIFIPEGMPDKNYAIDATFVPSSADDLPEHFRDKGHQQYSFGTVPPLSTLPDGKPSYVWQKLELEFDPVKYHIGIYVPGGPPWHPLDLDDPDDYYINRSNIMSQD